MRPNAWTSERLPSEARKASAAPERPQYRPRKPPSLGQGIDKDRPRFFRDFCALLLGEFAKDVDVVARDALANRPNTRPTFHGFGRERFGARLV